ncbi:hypothetical protein FMN50_27020 [Rhodobacterales bacterium]|nr:hypothetical protein FMN50_27020 [Rhodobacterales bacterium]
MASIFPGAARRPAPGIPKMKKPQTPISQWPPKGAVEGRWATEGNFWTHARSIGRQNPWDLIIFNFQTEDPREVNWYLQNLVGCWLLDPSGNFKFDSSLTADSEDGMIYLPPSSWVPPSHYSKGSGAATFMARINEAAATVLRGLSHRMPTVSHGATTMRAHDYKTIADLIETNEISIAVDPDSRGQGGYMDEDKTISLSFIPRIGNARHASTLANEAVHAATHYYEIPHNVLKNEYVSTMAGAIAMAVTSERVLMQYINPRRFKNWGYYYTGWVWLNKFKPRGIWSITLNDMDHQFEHPYLSTTANAKSELEASMNANYGGKGDEEIIPEWE